MCKKQTDYGNGNANSYLFIPTFLYLWRLLTYTHHRHGVSPFMVLV